MKTLKYAWRFLIRTKSYTIINVIGLALSLACTITLVRYIHQESQVNNHCVDAENVYIPLRDIDGNVYMGNTSLRAGADTVYYPSESIEKQARFLTFNNDNISIDDKPYTVQLLVADTAFFHFFNYPIEGVQMQLPNDALVTRKFAERVFGKENPIGRKVKYAGGHILTICGILNEPNYKSSLTFDIVFNISLKTDSRGWGKIHTDLLHFMPGVDVNAINAFSNVYRQTNKGYHIRFDFIPVSELYWNKELGAKGDSPEMWQYGSRSHLWILSGVCVLLMFAGILNFINIYLVFMLKRSKEYGIKKIFGIKGRTLFFQLWTENAIMVIIALFLGWFFIELFSGYVNRILESQISYTTFDWQLSLAVFLLLPLLTTVYPYIKYKYLPPIVSLRMIGTSRQSVKIRAFFLFIQYSITFLLIILSTYFSNHLHFLLNTDPGFRTEGILYANLMPPLPVNWWDDTEQESNKRGNNREVMEQILDECPYIESWYEGDPERTGILSTGSVATLMNDKGDKLNMLMMWVPTNFFKMHDLKLIDGKLSDGMDREDYQIVMNESALKAFGYTHREDAFIKGEAALWYSFSNGKEIEGGVSLMPVQAIVEDYYPGHLTLGKKPIVYMTYNGGINALCQIACEPGKEKELIDYLKKSRNKIYNTEEFDYRWLKDDIKELYQDDQRMATVFTLFAIISILVSTLGLFGLSLFDIHQRYKEIAIRKVNGAKLSILYVILLRKYIWIIAGAILLTVPLSYYLIYTYTSDFVLKTQVSILIYVIALLIMVVFSLGTLLWQVNKAAKINPAEIIKIE